MKQGQRELALTAIGMVAATIRGDDEGVVALKEGWCTGPVERDLLMMQLLELARRGVELHSAIEDIDPEEWLNNTALRLAAK